MSEAPREYVDEYGIRAALPIDGGQRVIPPGDFPTGPEVGERLPDFELESTTGGFVDLHRHRSDSKAAVVFFRSAVW